MGPGGEAILSITLINCSYRTRSNYSNGIYNYFISSLNMLHLEFPTRSIRPNGHTPVQ